EHERAADRIGLHQAAHVDVALGNDAVERGDDALVSLLLIEHEELRLLRLYVRLRDGERCLLRLEGLYVDGPLLLGHPALADEWAVTVPGHLRQIHIRLRLLLRRL